MARESDELGGRSHDLPHKTTEASPFPVHEHTQDPHYVLIHIPLYRSAGPVPPLRGPDLAKCLIVLQRAAATISEECLLFSGSCGRHG